MTITVTIHAESPAEFDQWVKRLRRMTPEGEAIDATWAPAEPKADVGEGEEDPDKYMASESPTAPAEQPKPEPKKRGRKKKVEEKGVAQTDTPADEEPETVPLPFAETEPAGHAEMEKPAETKPAPASIEGVRVSKSADDLREAIQRVARTASMEQAMGIVQHFKVPMVSAIPEDRWPEFDRMVAEALNAKEAA